MQTNGAQTLVTGDLTTTQMAGPPHQGFLLRALQDGLSILRFYQVPSSAGSGATLEISEGDYIDIILWVRRK